VVTDQFLTLAQMLAAADQIPDLAMAVMPHPIGGLTPEEVRAKADGVVGEVVSGLMRE